MIPTTDIVTGDTIRFTERVYAGAFRDAMLLGEREITALVLGESYGAKAQQHTFKLQILASSGLDPLKPGTVTTRKGRNLYRYGCKRDRWGNEGKRDKLRSEKHQRGTMAKAAREQRGELRKPLKSKGLEPVPPAPERPQNKRTEEPRTYRTGVMADALQRAGLRKKP